jgi:hypothetical protein
LFTFIIVTKNLTFAEPAAGFGTEDNFAFTPAEKIAVLSKAEETLKWALSSTNDALNTTPAEVFRKRITPIELMQAAAILREKNKIEASIKLRELLSYLNPTSAECFDIEDRLGNTILDSFKDDAEIPQVRNGGNGGWNGTGLNSTEFIRKGAEKFLRDDLTAAEKIAIINSPKKPIDLMKAIDLLISTGRAALTRHYLKKFLDTKITPAECAEIVNEIGMKRLIQIYTSRKLAPQGEQTVNLILNESKKYWHDPEVIAKAVNNLTIKFDKRKLDDERLSLDNFTPSIILPESLKTFQTIWQGGHISVVQLLSKLSTVNNSTQADEILTALLSIGGDVKESLAVSLNSDNPILLKNAIRGLNTVISQDEIFLLYPIAFSKKAGVSAEIKNIAYEIILSKSGAGVSQKNNIRNDIQKNSVNALYKRGRDYYSQNRHLRADENGYIKLWNWNEKKLSAEYIQLKLPDAYRLLAYRYAKLAYETADEHDSNFDNIKQFYAAALFDYISFMNGLDNPLDLESTGLIRVAASLSLDQLNRIITDAISEEHFEVARVAATAWRHVGDVQSFISDSGVQIHPLIRAVGASDRRLRFAALETIMQLNPQLAYQGSSIVTDTLIWFSRAEGRKSIVLLHPKLSEGTRLAGYFIPLGYSSEIATTFRKGFILAAESPDVEFIAVDSDYNSREVAELVRLLRKDNRTYNIPVAVFRSEPQKKPKTFAGNPSVMEFQLMQKADRLALSAPFSNSLSLFYPRPASDETAQFIESDLLKKTSTVIVPAVIRSEQAKKSLSWIKRSIIAADSGQKIYHYENLEEFVSRVVHGFQHIVEGLEIAAEIRSANMQLIIYDIAADSSLPISIRQQAAQFFESSIKKHGILLRGKQVQNLYDRYNASETESKESQNLLSRILDIVEEKAK